MQRMVVGSLLLLAALRQPLTAQTEGYVPQQANVRKHLSVLAHDSMEGRRAGTASAARAARYIASVMQQIGLEPGGDGGYLQLCRWRCDPGEAGSPVTRWSSTRPTWTAFRRRVAATMRT